MGIVPDISNCWVILPTYCEAENLPVMLDRLDDLRLKLNILIVDDNSPDGTGEIAAEHGAVRPNIRVLRRGSKAGLGAAYLAGFEYALDAGADAVVTMDCDLSHQPEEIPSLVDAISNAGCVVGSRYVAGGRIENWPERRRFLSAAANRFVRLLFSMPIADCTSGYRAYRRDVIKDILRSWPRSQGYSFQVEALTVAVAGPLPVIEVPIRFVERVAGNSKMGLNEIVYGALDLMSLRAKQLFKMPLRRPSAASGIVRAVDEPWLEFQKREIAKGRII